VASQDAVLEVDVNLFGIGDHAGNDARCQRAHFRLSEAQRDQPAVFQLQADVLVGKQDLDGIVGAHETAILADPGREREPANP
jgi:hypothetical protein